MASTSSTQSAHLPPPDRNVTSCWSDVWNFLLPKSVPCRVPSVGWINKSSAPQHSQAERHSLIHMLVPMGVLGSCKRGRWCAVGGFWGEKKLVNEIKRHVTQHDCFVWESSGHSLWMCLRCVCFVIHAESLLMAHCCTIVKPGMFQQVLFGW